MKTHLLAMACCLAINSASAQLTLNSNEMLPYGSVMHQKYILNFNAVDTNAQGANATWSFLGILPDVGLGDNYVTIANPSSTPYAANFPSSNYAYIEAPSTAYRYFSLTPAKMERVGSYVSSVNTYSDPQVEYVFPLTLGTTNMDTWDNTNSSFGGTYDIYCLGYGTLYLPGGTYNAMLVRANVDEGGIFVFPVYFWYSADNGAILLEYSPGDGLFVSEFGLYLHALTVSVDENQLVENLLYTNPVRNELSLQFTSKEDQQLTYTVTNSIGDIVSKGEYAAHAMRQSLNIDFSTMTSGLYFLSLQSRSHEQMQTIKIMKVD